VDGGAGIDFQTAGSHLQALEQYGESIGLDEANHRKLREKQMEKVTLQPSVPPNEDPFGDQSPLYPKVY
jgi:hypothetical protein